MARMTIRCKSHLDIVLAKGFVLWRNFFRSIPFEHRVIVGPVLILRGGFAHDGGAWVLGKRGGKAHQAEAVGFVFLGRLMNSQWAESRFLPAC